jgi:hypothetical protein
VANRDDLRQIARLLPAVTVDDDAMLVSVEGKALVWPWLERIDPKRARVPNPDVLAVRVAAESDKELLIDMDPSVFFTERHYEGYPAILVRLAAIEPALLEKLLTDAWRSRAPRRLLSEHNELAGPRRPAGDL